MHAYLILTNDKGVDIKNVVPNIYNPIHKHFFSKLKINDIRNLTNFLSTTGQEAHVIYFENFLIEAQNAFLKILEEPNSKKQIILITKGRSGLLDTIISRLNVVEINSPDTASKPKYNLIDLTITERLDVVKQVLNSEHDEIRPSAQKMISQILNDNGIKKLTIDQKQTLAKLYDYIASSGSSVKQILEFVVISL